MGYHDDFWLDTSYPNDWEGNDAYGPIHPAHPQWRRMAKWEDLGPNGERLRSEKTKWVWMHPNTSWKVWHLAGPEEGLEGVVLAKELEGVLQPAFDIKYSEGPYLIGADPERVDYQKRVINFGVWIQPNGNARRPHDSPFAFRLIQDLWNNSWSNTVPGYLGCFTRTHGWRWLKLLLGQAPTTTLSTDPVAHHNNTVMINMTAHAPEPFFSKRIQSKLWRAHYTQLDKHDVCSGNIAIANAGTWPAWPKFLITGHGDVTVQDGVGGRMVTLPRFYDDDGDFMLVDTDPTRRTITTQKDPVDGALFKFLRNSQLLDMLLHDLTSSKLPAQRRIPGGIGFANQIAPESVANLRVTHSNNTGTVTVLMPQKYHMGWA